MQLRESFDGMNRKDYQGKSPISFHHTVFCCDGNFCDVKVQNFTDHQSTLTFEIGFGLLYALLLSELRVEHIPNSISLYARSLVPYISDITIMC